MTGFSWGGRWNSWGGLQAHDQFEQARQQALAQAQPQIAQALGQVAQTAGQIHDQIGLAAFDWGAQQAKQMRPSPLVGLQGLAGLSPEVQAQVHTLAQALESQGTTAAQYAPILANPQAASPEQLALGRRVAETVSGLLPGTGTGAKLPSDTVPQEYVPGGVYEAKYAPVPNLMKPLPPAQYAAERVAPVPYIGGPLARTIEQVTPFNIGTALLGGSISPALRFTPGMIGRGAAAQTIAGTAATAAGVPPPIERGLEMAAGAFGMGKPGERLPAEAPAEELATHVTGRVPAPDLEPPRPSALEPAGPTGLPQEPAVSAAQPTAAAPQSPWQMTLGEYQSSMAVVRAKYEATLARLAGGRLIDPGSPAGRSMEQRAFSELKSDTGFSGTFTDMAGMGHKAKVRLALTEGKPVPPEVLADYPDLAISAAPPTAAAPPAFRTRPAPQFGTTQPQFMGEQGAIQPRMFSPEEVGQRGQMGLEDVYGQLPRDRAQELGHIQAELRLHQEILADPATRKTAGALAQTRQRIAELQAQSDLIQQADAKPVQTVAAELADTERQLYEAQQYRLGTQESMRGRYGPAYGEVGTEPSGARGRPTPMGHLTSGDLKTQLLAVDEVRDRLGLPTTLDRVATDAEAAAKRNEPLPAMRGAADVPYSSPTVLKSVPEIAGDVRQQAQNAFGAVARAAAAVPGGREAINLINPSALVEKPLPALVRALGEDGAVKLQSNLIGYSRKVQQGEFLANAIEQQVNQRARAVGLEMSGGKITSIPGAPALGDVAENPSRYPLTPPQRTFFDQVDALLKDTNAMEKDAGVKKNEIFSGEGRYFPRDVIGAQGVEAQPPVQGARPGLGVRQGFQKGRWYETQAEGMAAGKNYSSDIGALVANRVRAGVKAVADRQAVDVLKPLGRVPTADQPALFGEAGTSAPGLAGTVFPQEAASRISEALAPSQAGLPLRWLNNVNNIIRPIRITGNLAGVGLHLLTGAFRNTAAFARGAEYTLDGILLDGRGFGEYIQSGDNPRMIERLVAAGGDWSPSEFTFPEGGGLLRKVMSVTGAGRFMNGWSNGLNAATLEMFKGFVGVGDHDPGLLATWARSLLGGGAEAGRPTDEVAASLASTLTGRLSSRALGVGATQRQIEGAIQFAPRFYRATFGLLGDAIQGGFRGSEARLALGSFVAGTFALHYALARALGQEPNLDPRSSKFLTVQIGGQNMGIGGPIYGIMRAIAASAKDPRALLKGDMSNPALRWARGHTSPVLSDIVDLLQRQDYLGQPLDSPVAMIKHLAEASLPFAAETGLRHGPAAAGAQFFGGREFPVSTADQLQEAFKARGIAYDPSTATMVAQHLADQGDKEMANIISQRTLSPQAQDLATLKEQATQDPEFQYDVQQLRAGRPVGRAFRDWYRTYEDGVVKQTAALYLHSQAPPQNADLNAYYAIRPQVDPDTGQMDWATFDQQRAEALAKLPPEVQTAIKDRLRLPPLYADVERQYLAAKDARRNLYLIPKYRGFDLATQQQAQALVEAARSARQAVTGRQFALPYYVSRQAKQQGLPTRVTALALRLSRPFGASAGLESPEYARYIADHWDALRQFYPELRNVIVRRYLPQG